MGGEGEKSVTASVNRQLFLFVDFASPSRSVEEEDETAEQFPLKNVTIVENVHAYAFAF